MPVSRSVVSVIDAGGSSRVHVYLAAASAIGCASDFAFWARVGLGRLASGPFRISRDLPSLFAPDNERRQQAQDVFVRAVDEQAAAQRLRDVGSALYRQDPCPASSPSPRTSRMKSNFAASFSRPARNSAPRARMLASRLCFFITFRKSRAVAQISGPPPNVEPCSPGANADANSSFAMNRAKRQPAGQRLRQCDNVRARREFLVGERGGPCGPGRTEFRRRSARRRAAWQVPRALPEFFADRKNSALALNRLNDQGANVVRRISLRDPRHR